MGVFSSIASVLGISETAAPVTAAIAEIDPVTSLEKLAFGSPDNKSGTLQAFQYFPETISDTKAPEWVRKNVPGGSHPILTFINGGERVLSFSAVFTQDANPEPLNLAAGLLTGSFEVGLQDLLGEDNRKDTAKDIAGAIGYLRKFTYPEYLEDVASAPPFALVYLPNSGIIGTGNFTDSIIGAMVQCDVIYEKFHRNGSPRIVAVNLSFVETVQVGENWTFIGRKEVEGQITEHYSRAIQSVPPRLRGTGVGDPRNVLPFGGPR